MVDSVLLYISGGFTVLSFMVVASRCFIAKRKSQPLLELTGMYTNLPSEPEIIQDNQIIDLQI
jgi:hypothetical protein